MCIRISIQNNRKLFPLDNGTFPQSDKTDRRNRQLVRGTSTLEAATAPKACFVFLPAAADFLGALFFGSFFGLSASSVLAEAYCPFRE